MRYIGLENRWMEFSVAQLSAYTKRTIGIVNS